MFIIINIIIIIIIIIEKEQDTYMHLLRENSLRLTICVQGPFREIQNVRTPVLIK